MNTTSINNRYENLYGGSSKVKGVSSGENNEYKGHTKEVSGDSYEPSNDRIRQVATSNMIIDKGTASHTTIYVDRSTFNKIANYTTYNEECQWEELGVDGEKRWVVVNGQRFECPLSEEEKRARKEASKTLIDYMQEVEEERKKFEELEQVKFPPTDNDAKRHPKIEALRNNEPVMKMLREITQYSGGIKLFV